jgi:hypothetical protein
MAIDYASFKPKGFQPSSTSRFFVEILDLGSKVSSLKQKLLFLGDNKKLLIKEVEGNDGTIETGAINLTDFFKIEYPKTWIKPDSISITFIDDQNGKIYNFFHTLAEKTGLTKFRGIKPTSLQDYSISVRLVRYNRIGEEKIISTYSLFPKSLPKWVNSYDSESVQLFEIEFIVVDYKLEFN